MRGKGAVLALALVGAVVPWGTATIAEAGTRAPTELPVLLDVAADGRAVAVATELLTAGQPVEASAELAGGTVDLELDPLESGAAGWSAWSGTVAGEPDSSVTFVRRGQDVAGLVTTVDGAERIRTVAPGRQALVPVAAAFPEGPDVVVPPAGEPPAPTGDDGPRPAGDAPVAAADAAPVIDVLVGYTPAALAEAGSVANVESEAALAIASTNAAYAASGVTGTVRLTGTTAVDTDLALSSDALVQLTNASDGVADGIHAVRDAQGADLVSVLTGSGGSCGIAWLKNSLGDSGRAYGFSLVAYGCAVDNLSFAHELGHNLGLNHDHFVEEEGGELFAYGYGYVNVAAGWRTIMAYNDECAAAATYCQRLGRFSNPDQTYGGAPLGRPHTGTDPADNRRALNLSQASVAGYLGVPGAPTIGTASAAASTPEDGRATVRWSAPAATGGAAVTGYVVTSLSSAPGATPVARAFAGTATTQVVTGLTVGVGHTFTVAATNRYGTGPASAPSAAVVPTSVPGPASVSARTWGDGRVTGTLAAPALGGGLPRLGYRFRVTDVAAGTTTVLDRPDEGTAFTVAGLVNGRTYAVEVAARNDLGAGAFVAVGTGVPVGPPSVPTALTATRGNARATVTWSAPTDDGGTAVTGYRVTPIRAGVPQPAVEVGSSVRSLVVTGLTNGTSHTFTVAATNAQGTGPAASSAAIVPVAHAPFPSWSAFVTRQHVDLTTKAPSASALSAWVADLSTGTKSKGDLDDALRRGSENLANVDPVVRIYRAFLGRAPDASGLSFWIKRKRNVAPARTWTVSQIAAEFTRSAEFIRRYGSKTNREFVTLIYTDVLGRAADPSGVDYWTRKLDDGSRTRATVMVGFSESNEYRTKQARNTDVTAAYLALLGRAPTTGEAADWTTRQEAGTGHAALLAELLDGAEYAARVGG